MDGLYNTDNLLDEELRILDTVDHYDMLVRKARKITGFNALSVNNPKGHKNWKFFVKLQGICDENKWDANLYLDYAFIHVKTYWKTVYPTANQICSEKIQKSFIWWKEKEDRKHAQSLKENKKKSSKTTSFYEEIHAGIIKSIERVKYEMETFTDTYSPEVSKVMVILENLDVLSSMYLYSIDYVRDELINDLNMDNASMQELRQDFEVFNRSKAIREFIFKDVFENEKKNNMPKNITLKEFNEYAQSLGE